MSCCNYPPPEDIPQLWRDNLHPLLSFLEAAKQGNSDRHHIPLSIPPHPRVPSVESPPQGPPLIPIAPPSEDHSTISLTDILSPTSESLPEVPPAGEGPSGVPHQLFPDRTRNSQQGAVFVTLEPFVIVRPRPPFIRKPSPPVIVQPRPPVIALPQPPIFVDAPQANDDEQGEELEDVNLDDPESIQPQDLASGHDPLDPTDEVAPVDPADEVAPLDPAGGIAPVDPAGGIGPLDPSGEVAPQDPTDEVAPLDPAGGFAPVDPAAGIAPQDPAGGIGPLDPSGLEGLEVPAEEVVQPPQQSVISNPNEGLPHQLLPFSVSDAFNRAQEFAQGVWNGRQLPHVAPSGKSPRPLSFLPSASF